jgi:transposase
MGARSVEVRKPSRSRESPASWNRRNSTGRTVDPEHSAKATAVWTANSRLLLEAIENSEQGKQLARQRLKILHPPLPGKDRYSQDFEKWLRKVFKKESADGVQPWLTLEFWQKEIDRVLIEGIFGGNGAKEEVVARIRSVWPNLSAPWLNDRMEEVARMDLPRWMDRQFWQAEVDPILRGGIRKAAQCELEAAEAVLRASPEVPIATIWARLRLLRRERKAQTAISSSTGEAENRLRQVRGEAHVGMARSASGSRSRMERSLGVAEADKILLGGIKDANQSDRRAVERVLSKFPDLRIGTIWARLRRLREQQAEHRHAGGPFSWTVELDERLIRIHGEAGLTTAVSDIQSLTGWPRKAILRRAHKLGLPSRSPGPRRRWRMVEFRFAVESVNHMSVREIAKELGRSEKAVWQMLGGRGIEGRLQDGYSIRELTQRLHVRRASVRKWIESGRLHRKRNGRIDEESLQSFLCRHPETIRWPVLDEDTAVWVSEIVEAQRGKGQRC